ncbi:MAG: lysophospholipase [Eubacterium sp.]|nr:lysophospholipase [Eubacterium sp.]
MAENNIYFLGEEDFLPAMEGENRIWRDRYVMDGRFSTRDDIRLNYYKTEISNPKAAIVIVHGYCEFWGKYHEYAWYLWQAGYKVYFLEQRCHGYSGGKLAESDIIHIDSFKTYVEDLKEFMDKVVMPEAGELPLYILGHSMGGAVSALFLALYKDYFKGGVLTSPMFKIQTGDMPPSKIKAAKLYMKLFGKQKSLSPGQNHFDPKPHFETSSTLSEARYNYLFNQRLLDNNYRTAGASLGWVMAAIDVYKLIMNNASNIKIPIALMQAGLDTLVEAAGFDEFMKLVPQARLYRYENSKHEIFNAGDQERKKYFKDVLDTFEEFTNGV